MRNTNTSQLVDARPAMFETLEPRTMLSLVGIEPGFPIITYNSTGKIEYDATAETFELHATPSRFRESAGDPLRLVGGADRDMSIRIMVDNAGQLIGGAPGDDLIITGSIDVNGDGNIDYSGVLLTGEIAAFGFQDVDGQDLYDFLFIPTGGALIGYYGDGLIGITTVSENSTFEGSFEVDFTGGAKGNIGKVVVEAPPPSSLSGYVYHDMDDDGHFDDWEYGIADVQITLTGTNDLGQQVNLIAYTDDEGYYEFANLRPGVYQILQQQPDYYEDGKDTIGTQGGMTANDNFYNIELPGGTHGIHNNFGERLIGDDIHRGQTATIGYWQNKNGQALLLSLNGGPNATQLGNWLAETLPNLYGHLAGKTNAQIADYYKNMFKTTKGQKLNCQIMSTAFAVYVTNSSLAGNAAAKYGFEVSDSGTGIATWNVGKNGDAFGVANYSTVTVMQLLLSADQQTVNGVLYGGNKAFADMANNVFDGINQAGDIY